MSSSLQGAEQLSGKKYVLTIAIIEDTYICCYISAGINDPRAVALRLMLAGISVKPHDILSW